MPITDIPQLEVRHTAFGNVSNGPARWARAYQNAVKRRGSRGAKLYNWRWAVMAEVDQRMDQAPRGSVVFVHRHQEKVMRREYACSLECALLHGQLTINDKFTVEKWTEVFTNVYVPRVPVILADYYYGGITLERVDTAQLAREVTCRVCATGISGDRAVVKAIEKKTADVDTYILVNGSFLRLSLLKVVDLTQHDLGMLQSYGTPETRLRYQEDHGRPLSS